MSDDLRIPARAAMNAASSSTQCTGLASKEAMLVALDQEHLDVIAQSVPGGVPNLQDIYPLSPLQEGMLFHHLMNGTGDTYILSTLFELRSSDDVVELIDALQSVIEHHEILRGAILWEGLPQPVQAILRKVTLHTEQLTLAPEDSAKHRLMERMRPGKSGMDLRRPPLMRLTIAADRGSRGCFALLQIHHIHCDYRSWRTVVDETLAHMQGGKLAIRPAASYRDYVAWTLDQSRPQAAETFFRGKLSEFAEPTAPFGMLDVRGDGDRLGEARRVLRPPLADEIRLAAKRHDVSPARLIHAAWALVLAHTSGHADVVFGTTLMASHRKDLRMQSLVAMSVNTLPLRLNVRDLTARQLIEATDRELNELFAHELAPLTLVRRCSAVGAAQPLFTALLNYRRVAAEPSVAEDRIRIVADGDAWTNYPVCATVDDDGECFTITTQTVSGIDAHRLGGYLQTALQSLASLPDTVEVPALSLSIVPQQERHELLNLFNDTKAGRQDKLVHELFEQQVASTPTAVALVHGDRSITYEQLNNRANRLAQLLRLRGVVPDDVVAICIERGFDMIVGLLGILKSGAAYLPLDPNYPLERLQYMVEDAKPRVVLAQAEGGARLQVGGPIVLPIEVLDAHSDDAASNSMPVEIGLKPDHLLYVIYTSGSTGRPKGTAMPHRSMVNLLEWHRTDLPIASPTRVLQFAALSFDVAFQEVFSTLCGGGALVLLEEWVRRDVRALVELLRVQRVHRLFLPPLMLQEIAEFCRDGGTEGLRLQDVIVAGEQLRITEEIVGFFKRLPACRLHNHYGPTETHVVSALTMTDDPEHWPALPAIGKPIANTQMHVLDERGQMAPLGVAGEIYIAGANLARGYLNRPDLSNARFVANPLGGDEWRRMYKTGDLGRWRSDGMLEYLGRNDDQVKIRGFRVEIGEVEARLAKQEQVREVVVVAREDVPGDRRLVAYVTVRDPEQVEVAVLRKHAEASLPEHMVPSAFVVLENLPVTPSGKINRRMLPAPQADAYMRREYAAPQGLVEETLASIWRQLLHLEVVGRTDNFFELGGHSLRGMKVIGAVESCLGVRLPVSSIFQYPTIEKLARLLIAAHPNIAPTSAASEEFEEGIVCADPAHPQLAAVDADGQ